jgi:hypothetical protein
MAYIVSRHFADGTEFSVNRQSIGTAVLLVYELAQDMFNAADAGVENALELARIAAWNVVRHHKANNGVVDVTMATRTSDYINVRSV